jgi:hypothetical protein
MRRVTDDSYRPHFEVVGDLEFIICHHPIQGSLQYH